MGFVLLVLPFKHIGAWSWGLGHPGRISFLFHPLQDGYEINLAALGETKNK
jgi:hypothetical protein